jgi:hypothetical protein
MYMASLLLGKERLHSVSHVPLGKWIYVTLHSSDNDIITFRLPALDKCRVFFKSFVLVRFLEPLRYVLLEDT